MQKIMKKLSKIISIVLSLSIVFGMFSIMATANDNVDNDYVPFRVHVTINGDTKTQRGFSWFTRKDCKSVVTISVDSNPVVCDIEYDDVFEFEGNFCHKALVKGLKPGTSYSYSIGDGTNTIYGNFVTDDGDDSFKIIEIADIQASGLENFQKGRYTLDMAKRYASDAEFYINCGDITNDSDNEEWDYYAEAMDSFNQNLPIAPVAGNHDGLGVWHWFANHFNLDESESVQTLNGVNYSFDYGNAHIAMLNTNDVLSISLSQLKWLKNDMNSTDKDWKIVCMHKTPYTLGKDGKWPDALYLQRSLATVCDMCDVDLVLSGHDHQYLRTKPLYQNKVSDNGTVYVLSGTAGSKRYEIRSFLTKAFIDTDVIGALTIQKNGYGNYWNGENWDSVNEDYVGGCFNVISIDGGTLKFESYIASDNLKNSFNRIDGAVKHDEFILTKETGKNVVTYTGDNTTSDFEFYMGVLPSFFCLATYTFTEWLPKFLWTLPNLAKVYIEDDIF